MTDWTVVWAAAVSGAAALVGTSVGSLVEIHKGKQARETRQEDRDFERRRQRRQELIELEKALVGHIAATAEVAFRVRDEANKLGMPFAPPAGFNGELYDSNVRTAMMATWTGDDAIHAAIGQALELSYRFLTARNATEQTKASDSLSEATSRVNDLVYQRLKDLG